MGLLTVQSLWGVAMDYLSHCPAHGRHYMELLVERIPLTSEKKANQVIHLCQRYNLKEQSESLNDSSRLDLPPFTPFPLFPTSFPSFPPPSLPLADFILTYQDTVKAKKGKEDTDEKKDKRRAKRETFISNCEKAGLVFEHQDCSVSGRPKECRARV